MKKIDQDFADNLLRERKEIISVLRSLKMTQLDKNIPHQQVIPLATYSPWETDTPFKTVFTSVKESTLVDVYRCYELWHLVKETNVLSGDVIEIGVWRGGTAAILAKAAEDSSSKVYLCDTFEGVVKAGAQDTIYKGGEHSETSFSVVKNKLESLNITNSEVKKGIFPEDFADFFADIAFRFCHIDVDTYDSAKDCFEFIWPRICAGGIVVFDDYGFWGCEGVTKYCDEVNKIIADSVFIHNLNGHGVFIKVKR